MKPDDISALVARYPAERCVDPKTGKLLDRWKTPIARVAFEKIVEPENVTLDDGRKRTKWSCALLFPRGADLAAMTEAAKSAANARWPEGRPDKLNSPWLKQGQNVGKYDGFVDGAIYINVSSTFAPALVDPRGQPIAVSAATFYSGMWVRAVVTCYAYPPPGATGKQAANKGVSFGLSSFQFVAHDDKFGGSDPSALFGAIEGPGIDASPMQSHGSMNGATKAPVSAPSADEFGL